MSLYPLKFIPQFAEVLWGGDKLNKVLNKDVDICKRIGESWEISGVKGKVSLISNGKFKGISLDTLIGVYKHEIIGDKVYERYGNEFPLLIKFIDANDALSIQVHPDDILAKERHNSFGKTEMWYVLEAEVGAELISGFDKEVTRDEYIQRLESKDIESILTKHSVKSGDAFFIPAGRVHAIGKGILLAEIQQTSNVTYRLYDFDRKDANGNLRELHTEQAVDAINYTYYKDLKVDYNVKPNEASEVASCQYFTTNILELSESYIKTINVKDSFLIYMCLEGEIEIVYNTLEKESLKKGECILIPASLNMVELIPNEISVLLEVYI